jgi:uncharacterized protein (DUF58 family)
MRRPALLLFVLLATFVILGVLSNEAWADAGPRATSMSATTATTTVDGKPTRIQVRLVDAAGKPVGGALVRLVTTTTFFGTPKTEVLDEATTSSSGRTVLAFSPRETGSADVEVRYDGDRYYAASSFPLRFDVRRAATAYRQAPVGIRAQWAHAYLILVPFFGVWFTYGVVVAQIRRIRRAGAEPANA